MCADRNKQTPNVHGTKGEENTSSISENKEKVSDGYACIYECSKHLFRSKYEPMCTAKAISISQMEEIVEK